MNTAPSLVSLAEKSLANYVLGGGLLPVNNNEAFIRETTAVTVTILDENERVVACGAISPYSLKQAYCVLGEVDDAFRNHTIWIEEGPNSKKESRVYTIIKSVPYIIDRTAPTLFETVFADHEGRPTILHLFDALVEGTVGKTNLDLNKNVTIDLLINNEKRKEEIVEQWRDISGFVVSDKHRFEEVQVKRSFLLSFADEAMGVTTEPIEKENLLPILDYDAEASIYDRTEHVTALVHTPGVVGKMALRGGQVCGYALVCKNRILLCYADDEDSFKALVSSVAENIEADECKMFLRFESHEATQRIIENATERKEVTRLHTRTNINGIKWSLIYCSNVGLHIF
ncbi:hypothetical protein V3C99_017450 [Haemonchus contortus]|uniref:Acetyltransf_18 domain-containing protein n=1 Tax=Haemonchus contortus TaxID=6289 RepID=A0A7I4Z733_HAECO|nr:Protein C01B10.11 [Haemonchus contortus]